MKELVKDLGYRALGYAIVGLAGVVGYSIVGATWLVGQAKQAWRSARERR